MSQTHLVWLVLPREQLCPIKYRLKLNNDECSVLHAFIPQEYWAWKKTIYMSYRVVRSWVACEDVWTLGVLPETKLKFPDHVTTIGFENLESVKMNAVFQDNAKQKMFQSCCFNICILHMETISWKWTLKRLKICRAQTLIVAGQMKYWTHFKTIRTFFLFLQLFLIYRYVF